MIFKFSLIFVQLYCLFGITRCVQLSQFDLSDLLADSSYTTRALVEPDAAAAQAQPAPPANPDQTAPAKTVYKLADHFAADLRLLVHKITQTFVQIGQKKVGQKTLYHIYDEWYAAASDEGGASLLNYLMARMAEAFVDENASAVIMESVDAVQDLLSYNLAEWYFVVPFLYDLNRDPVLIQLVEKGVAELDFINENEARRSAAAALFSELRNTLKPAGATATDAAGSASVVATSATGTEVPISDDKNAKIASADETKSISSAGMLTKVIKRAKSLPNSLRGSSKNV